MAFGIEVVIPIKVRVPSVWVANYDEQANSKRQLTNLDLIDEVRKKTCIEMAAYHHKVTRYINAKV